ncbi:hypothetical protein D3C85_1079640 [compost metagenome]
MPHGALQAPGDALIGFPRVAQANHCAFNKVAGRRQWLAQLVGDGHGHFAHGVVARQVLELLLADPPRLFGQHLFGHIAEQQQMADQIVLDLDVAAGCVMPAPFAVPALHLVVHVERRVLRRLMGELLQQALTRSVVAPGQEVLAHQLVHFAVEQVRAGVADKTYIALGAEHRHTFGQVLHEGLEPALETLEVALDLVLLGNVAELHHQHIATVQVHQGRHRLGQNLHPLLGAIAPLDGALPGARRAFEPAQADRTSVLRRIAGHVRGLERRQLLQGKAQRRQGSGVGPENLLGVRVMKNDAQRHGFDQRIKVVRFWLVHRTAPGGRDLQYGVLYLLAQRDALRGKGCRPRGFL